MTVKLSDIAEVIAGQSPPSESYNQDGKGIPFFQGKADFNEMFPTVRYWCESPIKFSLPNDILFSLRAPVGPTNVNNVKACIGRGIAAIRCKDSVDLKFLLHFLRANENKIAALGTGSTFKAITIGVLKDLQIPLPPLSEQKRIAELLDAADSLRKKDKALLEKYDQLAQSLFLEMFGDPVKNEKGWEVKELGEICDVRDGTHDSPKYYPEGYMLITSKNIKNGQIDFTDVNFISEDDFNKINLRSKVHEGDILMPMIGTIGNPVLIKANPNFAIKNVALIKGNIAQDVKQIVILFLLKGQLLEWYSNQKNKGGTQKFLSLGDIRKIPIYIPDPKLQDQFAEQVQLIERQKEIVKQNLEKSEEMMKGLMGEVFG